MPTTLPTIPLVNAVNGGTSALPATPHTRGVRSHVGKMVVASLRDALWRVVAAITTPRLTACMVLIALRALRLSEAAGH